MPKVDLSGPKGFLLAHGEKIGFAFIIVVAVMLIFAGMSTEGLPAGRAKQDIANMTTSAQGAMNRYKEWNDYPNKRVPSDTAGASIMDQIKLSDYRTETAFDPLLKKALILREDPVLYPPEDIELHVGVGAIAFQNPAVEKPGGLGPVIGPPGGGGRRPIGPGMMVPPPGGPGGAAPPGGRPGARPPGGVRPRPTPGGGANPDDAAGLPVGGGLIDGVPADVARVLPADIAAEMGGVQVPADSIVEGRNWIVVNALVPLQKQTDAYDSVLRDAGGYYKATDTPLYIGYIVQRAEVTSASQEPAWTTLIKFHAGQTQDITKTWAVAVPEIVDESYVHPDLVFPLPPLLLRNWGHDVTHSKVPLTPSPDELNNAEPVVEEPVPVKNPDDDVFEGGGVHPGAGGMTPGLPGGRMPVGPGNRGVPGGIGLNGEKTAPPVLLVRFIDMTVLPGRQYRYRAQLVTLDPNHAQEWQGDGAAAAAAAATGGDNLGTEKPLIDFPVPKKFLSPKVIARLMALDIKKRKYRLTDWSKPSEVALVPIASSLFAGDVLMAPRFSAEPVMHAMVEAFDLQNGETIVVERDVSRGTSTNFTKEKVNVIDPLLQNFKLVESQRVRGGQMVLDIRGGEKLDAIARGNEKSYGEMLFLGPDDQLHVADAADDALRVRKLKKTYIDAPPPLDGAGLLEDGMMMPGLDPGAEMLRGGRPGGRTRPTTPDAPGERPTTPRRERPT